VLPSGLNKHITKGVSVRWDSWRGRRLPWIQSVRRVERHEADCSMPLYTT